MIYTILYFILCSTQIDVLAISNLNESEVLVAEIDNFDKISNEELYLKSVLYFKEKQFDKQIKVLNRLLERDPNYLDAKFQRAKASYQLKEYKSCFNDLHNIKLKDKLPIHSALEILCSQNLNNYLQTWLLIKKSEKFYKDSFEIFYSKLNYFLSIKMFHESNDMLWNYIKKANKKEDSIKLVSLYLRFDQTKEATLILEYLKLKFKNDIKITEMLSGLYLNQNATYTSAKMISNLARVNPEYSSLASDLWRKSGFLKLSEYWNIFSVDAKDKLRQRLALSIDGGEFAKSVSLRNELDRMGLLREPSIVYALAYSHFRLSQFDVAEKLLNKISAEYLKPKVLELQKSIGFCRSSEWACL